VHTRIATLIACAFLSATLSTENACAADPGIWGRTVMSQAFDEKPFREVNVPGWLLETVNYCYGLQRDWDSAVKYGAQMGEVVFGGTDHFKYESKFVSLHPNVSVDAMAKEVQEFRKRGVRLVGAFAPCLQKEIYDKHPEFRGITENSTRIPNSKSPEGGWLCQIGPWGDMMIKIMLEIIDKHDVDAFGFDGIHHRHVCYCADCRTRYRKETRKEIPDVDMNNPEFRSYLLWYDREMERFIERIQTAIKTRKPDCALVTWTTNAGRFGHLLEIPRSMPTRMNLLFDAPCQEFWLDETNRGPTVVPAFANAYIWATTNHRIAFSEPYLFSHGNPYGPDSFPHHEVRRRAMLALTHGAHASIATGWGEHLIPAAWQILRDVDSRSPWLTHKHPEPWAAMVMSDNTRVFYGRESGKVEERYLSNVFGTFRAGLEEHLPVAVINDWNLNDDDLAPYKVLVLPNTACLNPGQIEAVKKFVKRGGGLVSSVDASLSDETGTPHKNFGLADVFGVDYRGIPARQKGKKEELDVNFLKGIASDYWEKRKNVFSLNRESHSIFDHPKLKEYVGDSRVTFKGQAVAVTPREGAKVIASISPRNLDSLVYPAIVLQDYGKGRSVYMAAGLDSAYYLYSYPYQRLMLAQAMRWAANVAPPISVDAPMCVHSSFFRQKKDGERLVVHLYNDINTTGGHAYPRDDAPLREETLPIHDIRVRFGNYKISRVHLEPEGVDLPMHRQGEATEVNVPKLEIHSMVVAELE
jgi:hypothetical protein